MDLTKETKETEGIRVGRNFGSYLRRGNTSNETKGGQTILPKRGRDLRTPLPLFLSLSGPNLREATQCRSDTLEPVQ